MAQIRFLPSEEDTFEDFEDEIFGFGGEDPGPGKDPGGALAVDEAALYGDSTHSSRHQQRQPQQQRGRRSPHSDDDDDDDDNRGGGRSSYRHGVDVDDDDSPPRRRPDFDDEDRPRGSSEVDLRRGNQRRRSSINDHLYDDEDDADKWSRLSDEAASRDNSTSSHRRAGIGV